MCCKAQRKIKKINNEIKIHLNSKEEDDEWEKKMKNYKKKRRRLRERRQKTQVKIKNMISDFHHKVSTFLVKKY